MREQDWQPDELLSGARYPDSGGELEYVGLFVDLGPWAFHLLEAKPYGAATVGR